MVIESQREAADHRPGLRLEAGVGLDVLEGHRTDRRDPRPERVAGSALIGLVLVVTRSGRAIGLAVEVGDRHAPGAGLVRRTDVEATTGVGTLVVGIRVGTTDREAGEAQVDTSRPDARIGPGRRLVVGPVVTTGHGDIEAVERLDEVGAQREAVTI